MKLYMVVEHFVAGRADEVYARFHAHGRMLPGGLEYVDSWLAGSGDRCFQLMRANDLSSFGAWIEKWQDLVEFEIVELGEKPSA